jgi:hypothetical protein
LLSAKARVSVAEQCFDFGDVHSDQTHSYGRRLSSDHSVILKESLCL